jgi:hypothetical protein
MGWMTEGLEFNGQEFSFLHYLPDQLWGGEADHSSPTSAKGKENVDLYIHSPI